MIWIGDSGAVGIRAVCAAFIVVAAAVDVVGEMRIVYHNFGTYV